MSIRKEKIIIDTDPGHDDALAILLLEKSGLFNIEAITTVAGNSDIQNTTNNTRYVLDLISSKTPIYSGSEKPLSRKLVRADVHGESGLAGAIVKKEEKLLDNAVEKIIEIIKKNPKEVSIVAIGPETNIAKAFIKEPKLPSLIKEIVIMGGAVNVPGNKNGAGEFNIFVDPEAADIVFKSNVKKILIPLDVCNKVFFNLSDFDKLQENLLYNPIKDMMRYYIEGIEKFEGTVGALMYDPLAAYYLINPDAYKTELMNIKIGVEDDNKRGVTMIDSSGHEVQVVVSVNKTEFEKDFFAILNRQIDR